MNEVKCDECDQVFLDGTFHKCAETRRQRKSALHGRPLDDNGAIALAPKALDTIVDKVLTYKPKAKSKPARKRARRAKKIAKEAV
jgi:hypothetical protein